ncbi:MAG TPA: helix-turn-helix domain-containing protein [Ornithinibacter sp.]|nr:helix-turn-helix domain-containing protein [Ornithinibacter sp.]
MTQLLARAVLSVGEVADLTGETPRTIQRKARDGIYPAHKMPGRTGAYIFERSAVDAIVEELEARKAS